MKKTLGVILGLALASMARGQAIADYAQLISNFAVRLDSGSGVAGGSVTGGTCTNQVVTALDTSGVPTCASVASTMIPAGTVTLSNIAVAAANSKLLGSGAAGSGAAYSELTLGTNLSMSGTTLNAAGAGVTLQGSSPGTADVGNMNISGIGIVDRDALTTTTTEAFSLRNNTASTGGATRQVSPSLNFYGHAWNTATDDTDISRLWVDVGTAATTTMTWKWDTNIAGGGYVNAMTLTNSGALTTVAGITSGTGLTVGGGNTIAFNARSVLASSASGSFTLFNSGQTDFTALKFGGTSASFPELKKEAATQISSRLADDSAYAGFVADNYWVQTGSGGVMKTVQTTDPTTVLATGATTTATAGNLVTGPCKLIAVIGRLTAAITTATSFTVKVTGGNVLNQIGTATTSNVTLAQNTTYTWVPAAFADQYYTSASTLTVTTSPGNPGAGAIHFTVFCETFVPPTS